MLKVWLPICNKCYKSDFEFVTTAKGPSYAYSITKACERILVLNMLVKKQLVSRMRSMFLALHVIKCHFRHSLPARKNLHVLQHFFFMTSAYFSLSSCSHRPGASFISCHNWWHNFFFFLRRKKKQRDTETIYFQTSRRERGPERLSRILLPVKRPRHVLSALTNRMSLPRASYTPWRGRRKAPAPRENLSPNRFFRASEFPARASKMRKQNSLG